MSTRTAKDDSTYHQSRYASSQEFERGLIANLVAKRCALLDDKADRELIWFVQKLSHQEGGLALVAKNLIEKFPHLLGTVTMVQTGKGRGKLYTADEVRKIRAEMPPPFRKDFPLRGETNNEITRRSAYLSLQAARSRFEVQLGDLDPHERDIAHKWIRDSQEAESEKLVEIESAKKHPTSYPVDDFLDICSQCAADGEGQTRDLETELHELCLKPSRDLSEAHPWYFAGLVAALRELQCQWIDQNSKVLVTELGKKVCDTLEYSLQTRSLCLLEGNPRLGKSFSARAWCEQHPGQARFIEVPSSNDDATFFRAMARGLGLGNFLKYKVGEVRERVESVLLTGDLLLVLDEAQRLWPQRNLRYGFPSRIIWVMTLANAGVPVCMVSTPQFTLDQKAIEKTGWNSAQLTGRIGHYEFLPAELSETDLMNVARSVLPEASDKVLQVLADYASTSARYLAAVDSIAKRAKYIAQRNHRQNCSTDDVRTAMKESVIPSDTRLARSLDQARKNHNPGRQRLTDHSPDQNPPSRREALPAAETNTRFSSRADACTLIKA